MKLLACTSTRAATASRTQRGMVLLIALVVMAAMALTGAALVRSVDTTTAVAGNLALREASIEPANAAIEEAIAALYENNLVPDRGSNVPARSYYAWRQAGEDARGVPLVLQMPSRYPQAAPLIDAGNGNSVRYIVERLCATVGPAGATHCNMIASHGSIGIATQHGTSPPPDAAFRITARVDGPQNTVSHVQVMLRDGASPRRLSWRILTD